jgi:hypothetical protein
MDNQLQAIKNLKVLQILEKLTKMFGWLGWFGVFLIFLGFKGLVLPNNDQYSDSKEYLLNGLIISGPMKKSMDEIEANLEGYKSLRDKKIKDAMLVIAVGGAFILGGIGVKRIK